jgi:putative Mn2+ efflux pump MntP
MSLPLLLLVGLGLAMDCLAVSIATGVSIRDHRVRCALRLGVTFGLFQALLFLLGWLFGSSFRAFVAPVDHWIAMLLLGVIGLKMARDAFAESTEPPGEWTGHPGAARLLVLGLATSVDAFAVGLGLSLLDASLALSTSVIGVFSFGLSVIGVLLGARLGAAFGRRAELLGGLVLLGIGLKTFISHVTAGI